jgi:nicotinamide mononucleotide transporter
MIALEIIAVTMGVGSVFLSLKRNIWVYPVGIISTGIYVYLLYVFGLLGDCLINIYYTGMSIYGWVLWSKNTTDNVHINVSVASKKEWIQASLLFIGSLLLVILVYYYKPWLDNDFDLQGVTIGLHHLDWANWLDVFTTSVFLIGMWLMAKQKLENWLFWIIGDLICIPMFVYKGLIFTSLQYFVFSILAIIAYFEWRKNYRLNQ